MRHVVIDKAIQARQAIPLVANEADIPVGELVVIRFVESEEDEKMESVRVPQRGKITSSA